MTIQFIQPAILEKSFAYRGKVVYLWSDGVANTLDTCMRRGAAFAEVDDSELQLTYLDTLKSSRKMMIIPFCCMIVQTNEYK